MKKLIVLLLTVILMVSMGACGSEKKDAIEQFNAAAEAVEDKNAKLQQAIDNAQSIIDTGEIPLDETTLLDLKESITNAESVMREIPALPEETEEIISATKELDAALDYSQELEDIQLKETAFVSSTKQLIQVTNPSENFVIERLNTIDTIIETQAVTEDNDPNGNLNKAGGYTATVYFTNSMVEESVSGEDVVAKGTDGGGAVEVYSTAEDAQKRNDYLAGFDGGILASGSHKVLGTTVIRTSNYLKASQQTELEQQIVDALIKLG